MKRNLEETPVKSENKKERKQSPIQKLAREFDLFGKALGQLVYPIPENMASGKSVSLDQASVKAIAEALRPEVEQMILRLNSPLMEKLDQLMKRMDNFEKRMDTLEKNVQPIEDIMEKVMDENVQREIKKKELIIKSMPESTKVTPAERINEEKENAFQMMKPFYAGLEKEDIVFCRRMGAYRPEGQTRPRLLQVGLISCLERERILIGAKRAKNFGLRPSLTKMQMEKMKDLYKERDQKNGENPQGGKIWIVAGPPGEQQLRQVNKRNTS